MKVKCSFVNDKIMLCDNGLKKRISGVNGHVSGFTIYNMMGKNGYEFDLGVCYKVDRNDKAIMLNYCPFCRAAILNKKHIKNRD